MDSTTDQRAAEELHKPATPNNEPAPTLAIGLMEKLPAKISQAVQVAQAAPNVQEKPTATFAHYEILQEIARGGMGIVYRARQVGLGRVIALKMIADSALAGPEAIHRFHTEAQAASSLDHPNIVPIYEVGEHEGNHYFTMKLIQGEDLSQWIKARRVPMQRLSLGVQRDMARLLAAVAGGIHHAHQRGVLHRDVKPANILLQKADSTSEGRKSKAEIRNSKFDIKAGPAPDPSSQSQICDLKSAIPMVTDFGLAKRVDGGDDGVSQSRNVVGTPYYMPPEQALAKKGTPVTVAADVYSLGAVLYEMLTGRPPFRGETYFDTLVQVVHQPVVPPRQLDPSVNADLERICLKCLRKAPEERYSGADALAEDLDSWASGGPISVRAAGPVERLGRWCRRNPLVAALLFAVIGLLSGGAIYSTAMNVRLSIAADDLKTARDAEKIKADEAEANAEVARIKAIDADRNAASEAAARALAVLALHEKQAALKEEKNQRAKSRHLLVRQYVGHGAGFLDDGDPLGAVAYFAEALNLEQGEGEGDREDGEVDADRQKPHRVRLAAALRRCPRLMRVSFHKSVRAFALSGDGRFLFIAEREGQGRLLNIATDRIFHMKPVDAGQIVCGAFSPDSRWLATGDADGVLLVWDLASGTTVGRAKHNRKVTHLAFSADGKRLLSASLDGTARVWDPLLVRALSPPLKHGEETTFVAFNADASLVVTAGVAGSEGADARVWNWVLGKQLNRLPHKLSVATASFGSQGGTLYTSATNHNVRGWNLATSKPLVMPIANPWASTGLWFHPDGQRCLQAQDMTAQVVDLTTGQPVGKALTHGGNLLAAAFSPDGRLTATSGWDRVVRVWETASGQPLTPPLRHPRRVLGVAFDSSGHRLVTNCEDGSVRVWDIRRRDQAAPPLDLKAIEMLAVAPGAQAVVGLSQGQPKIWELMGDTPVSQVLPGIKPARAAFSSDGKHFLTLDKEALRLWDRSDIRNPKSLMTNERIEWFGFSPGGSRVVVRLLGDQYRTWNTDTGKDVAAGKLLQNASNTTAWNQPVISADGRKIVTLKFKQMAVVSNLTTGKAAAPSLKHPAGVIGAVFSPNGQHVATACADGTVPVWHAGSGEPLTPPMSHGQFLTLVNFSFDGRLLVTAGNDGRARVWDSQSGQAVTPLLRQAEAITEATFSPQGERLATVGTGGIVRIWDLRPDRRAASDLLLLTRLLSGQRMHSASGSFVPFEAADLRQTWPQLRVRFPVEFGQE